VIGEIVLNIKANKWSKKIFIILLSAIILLGILKVGTVFADSSKKVKVAFFDDRPYFTSMDEQGKKSGYAYDYLQMLSSYTGWEYEYVYGSYNDLYKEFVNGEIDIFPFISKTPENEQKMLFPKYNMGNVVCRLYTLDSQKDIVYNDYNSGEAITIGVTAQNVLNEGFADALAKEKINYEFVKFNTYDEKMSAFENGEIDAIIDFEALADQSWKSVTMLGSFEYYLAVSDERNDLYDQLNETLRVVYDRSPYYNNIMYYNYYPKESLNKSTSESERKWLENADEIRIGIIDNKKLALTNDSDQNRFIKIVIARLLYELNLSTIEPVYIEYPNYNKLLEALQNGEVDAAYSMYNDKNMAEYYGYSVVETLEETPLDIVTALDKNIDEIKTIAVSDMKLYYFSLINYPNAEIISYSSQNECFDAVLENKVDATIAPCHLTPKGKVDAKYNNLVFKDTISLNCALVVNKDQTELFSLLSRGVALVDFEYINHISKGTSYSAESYTFSDFLDDYFWIINAVIIIIAVLLMIVLTLSNMRLRNIKKHREATIYQCALYSQAIGYYQCNLTKDLMLSPYMKIIDGEPVDIEDYAPAKSGTSFSSLMDYIASHYIVSRSKEFREFMNPDKLIESFNNGELNPEFSCWVIVPHDGEKLFQRYSYFLSQDKSKDIIATCIVYDMSEHEGELEKQRVKAEIANVAKSTFLFNMTHDVRTPMNAIIGYANMAKKYNNDHDKVQECIDKIQVSSKQLLTLLDDALDMSRVESGNVMINEHPVNFLDCVNRAVAATTANAKAHGITAKFHIGNMEEHNIYVDALHLNKILCNVVDNAIKYSHPGGTIKITISQKKLKEENFARYVFVVEDHGIGMSPEFLGHIYEMFAREESSTISGISGTGVGMAITKKLVDLMGGTIDIESKKGEGTRVKITFDFNIQKIEPVIEEKQEEEVSFEGKRVLLVEDIEINREIAKEILEEEGIIVEEAFDGSIALDMVSKSQPGYYALVFMDIQMPVMDGYEATRQIRKLENSKLAEIPIVAMTANVLDEDVQNSLEAGMNAHLAKPIDVVALFETMSKYMK